MSKVTPNNVLQLTAHATNNTCARPSVFRSGSRGQTFLANTENAIMRWCSRYRVPLSDEQFVAACGLLDIPEASRVALAVRHSVANYGMVDHRIIYASDRYPGELAELSDWDSIDFLAWLFSPAKPRFSGSGSRPRGPS